MFSRIPKVRSLLILAVAAMFSVAFAPGLHASALNQRTLVTVNAPVQIPGRVLPAGTYSFQVLDHSGARVVIIRNHKTGNPVGFVLGSPIFRREPTDKAVVTLAERPSNSAPAISKWFYPGFYYGLQFIYPRYPMQPTAVKVPQKLNLNS